MSNLREAQKRLTTDLLLAQGLKLFVSKGYAATTVDDIAASAGATRTTFYLHFPSKAQLVLELIRRVDEIFNEGDETPLARVVELGRRDLVEGWLSRKFDQWAEAKPYILSAHQAAASEPAVAEAIEQWFQDSAKSMQEGLDRADRFEAESRRVRCVLAFGELEFLSRRWFQVGWVVDREVCLSTLTDSWCHLLSEPSAE